MVPDTYAFEEIDQNEEDLIQPSSTYRIDWENQRILGTVDGLDAVMQFIEKVFTTDKYAYEIYDWYYGNELYSLVGQPQDFIEAEIPRIFEEALLPDERILEIGNYAFTRAAIDSLIISCTIYTIYGSNDFELEVAI